MNTPGSTYPMFLIDTTTLVAGAGKMWVNGIPTGRWELRWTDVLEKWEKQVLYIEVEVAVACNRVGSRLHWVSEDDIKLCREKFRFPEDYIPPTPEGCGTIPKEEPIEAE